MGEQAYSCMHEAFPSTSDDSTVHKDGDNLSSGSISAAQMNFMGPCLSRCSSASSLVTYAKLSDSNKPSLDEQDGSTDANVDTADSLESNWTDDQHSSYLNFMEETFVKEMYERQYCALDVCGQAPHHDDLEDPNCAESLMLADFGSTKFKSCQYGDWRQIVYAKRPMPASNPLALLKNPWVQHFRPQACRRTFGGRSDTKFVNSPRNIDDAEKVELQELVGTSTLQRPEAAPDVDHVAGICHFASSSKQGVKNKGKLSIFIGDMDGDTDISTLKQQLEQSLRQKTGYTHSLQQGCLDVNNRKRGSLPAFEQSPFGKQKTSSGFCDGQTGESIEQASPHASSASYPDS